MHGNGFLKVLVTIIVVNLLLDWYIFAALKSWTRDLGAVLLRRIVLSAYLFLSLGSLVVLVIRLRLFTTASGMRPFNEWVLSIFLTFFITKIFFALVLLMGDIARLISALARLARPGSAKGPFMPSRRAFIVDVAILFASVPFLSFFYAMLGGKYNYKVHKITLTFPDLPAAFDGFTITQLSDIHSGSFDNVSAVQAGIDLAKAQKSDLFVFTGDLVNNTADEIEPYLNMFGSIKAPYGQYSILGNHDYGDYIQWPDDASKEHNLTILKEHHRKMGYRLLLDESVKIEKEGAHLSLVGVQNWGRGFIQKGDLDKAVAEVGEKDFKILLSHDPTHWEEKVRYHPSNIQLTLSGHTHGAQFGVETAGFRWSPVKYRYLDWAGLASEHNRYLYVNRGFGFLAFSGRLGIWPEVTVIELKKSVS